MFDTFLSLIRSEKAGKVKKGKDGNIKKDGNKKKRRKYKKKDGNKKKMAQKAEKA